MSDPLFDVEESIKNRELLQQISRHLSCEISQIEDRIQKLLANRQKLLDYNSKTSNHSPNN